MCTMKKTERAHLFRRRISEALLQAKISRSELARQSGADRSTIAQLLNDDEVRLPNAHLAAEFATALGVSADWLLGLSNRRETSAELLLAEMRFKDAKRTPSDEQIIAWHKEAAGRKIRHVPATLPDLLKIPEVLDWEYASFSDKTPEQASQSMRDMADWLEAPGSDYEICVPLAMVQSMAWGEGYWKGLPADICAKQIEWMASRCEALYPSMRLYLYDDHQLFSAPVSIFGSLIAAVYVGRFYMVYRERSQVQALTQHFDELVRESNMSARSTSGMLRALLV